MTDSPSDAAEKNLYVNKGGTFLIVDDYKTFDPVKFSNFMAGNFLRGEGAENYIFPKNGVVSNELKDSKIVSQAIDKYKETNKANFEKGTQPKQISMVSEFGAKGFASTIDDKGSILSVAGFVGSALITVKPLGNDSASVSIFNVTSMSSGDYGKLNPLNIEAKSVTKNLSTKDKQPYTNISQFYSFDIKLPR